MKIGILSSGTESLWLFKFLHRYEHEYIIYLDSLHAPYGDKSFEKSALWVEQGIEILKAKGVEKIIVPPVHELALLEQGTEDILPLFKNYCQNYVFSHSLVGKIGIFWDLSELAMGTMFIKDIASNYKPSPQQLATKSFHFPFAYWRKATPLFKHLLTHLSWKQTLVNTTIKNDLRYFKDAMVDTLIPLNYSYFNAEKMLKKFFNFKKIRFHGLDALEQIFLDFQLSPSAYCVEVLTNDTCLPLLLQEKRLLWLLKRGENTEIIFSPFEQEF